MVLDNQLRGEALPWKNHFSMLSILQLATVLCLWGPLLNNSWREVMSASEKSLEVGMFVSQPMRVINPLPAKPRVGLSGVPKQSVTQCKVESGVCMETQLQRSGLPQEQKKEPSQAYGLGRMEVWLNARPGHPVAPLGHVSFIWGLATAVSSKHTLVHWTVRPNNLLLDETCWWESRKMKAQSADAKETVSSQHSGTHWPEPTQFQDPEGICQKWLNNCAYCRRHISNQKPLLLRLDYSPVWRTCLAYRGVVKSLECSLLKLILGPVSSQTLTQTLFEKYKSM